MKFEVRLPLLDCHIPVDGEMPDGLGLPVRANFDGEPVGKVVGWEDQGDGTVVAQLDVDHEDLTATLEADADLSFGIDGDVKMRFDQEQPVIEHIAKLNGVGVWPTGSRGVTDYGH